MTESLPAAARSRPHPGAFVFRIVRRTLVESLYLFTAPVIAGAGLMFVLGGLCLGTAGWLLPGGSRLAAAALAPARWFADLEWWRIAAVRLATGTKGAGEADAGIRRRPESKRAAPDPALWLDVAHAMVVFPVALVTSVVAGMWWLAGLGASTAAVRNPGLLSSSGERLAFVTVLGLALLLTLPLVTRACLAAQTGMGQALLSGSSALHRRISGLEQERDTARAQTVAAVSAEATALRRLERDIHDGPQQRLVRLAMDLGRAQHNFDSRPEAVREALADAIAQTQEALEELRALSRGIAPPVLVDRGLREALTALAALSTVPTDLDIGPLDRRPGAAVETAAYFVIAEALTNVAKHSQARRCAIGLRHGAGSLLAWVSDDGVGGAALDKGHGLRGLADRVHAAGGRLRITSPPGGPTTITAELPCR